LREAKLTEGEPQQEGKEVKRVKKKTARRLLTKIHTTTLSKKSKKGRKKTRKKKKKEGEKREIWAKRIATNPRDSGRAFITQKSKNQR